MKHSIAELIKTQNMYNSHPREIDDATAIETQICYISRDLTEWPLRISHKYDSWE